MAANALKILRDAIKRRQFDGAYYIHGEDEFQKNDAVKQLVAVYPPASTRFDLQHATPDAFGSSLVESLRAKGYALLEFKPAAPASAASAATDATATAGKPLRYILDQAESNLYRVTLLVGNQSLTRAYSAAQNGTLYPAGAWVRKE